MIPESRWAKWNKKRDLYSVHHVKYDEVVCPLKKHSDNERNCSKYRVDKREKSTSRDRTNIPGISGRGVSEWD
ncbi:hypothetical protein TNCT_539761 [Trichonephila clavata]|uniref:Uncharacterized protein n=1 Tax=Trichonephila clavata TaxID=2740835 RepID=A0A8X6K799_TRICU|nr:hypothetical protein TNCT_539761 [Trichonephila clavata]